MAAVPIMNAAIAGSEPVVLAPGQLFFGCPPGAVQTLLGSCVAITLWHPEHRCGGMCHYLLGRPNSTGTDKTMKPSGYYASEAIKFLAARVLATGCRPKSFEAKMFGGGQMFENSIMAASPIDVAGDNVEIGLALLDKNGFRLRAADTGGDRYRKVFLDLASGEVRVWYGRSANGSVCVERGI